MTPSRSINLANHMNEQTTLKDKKIRKITTSKAEGGLKVRTTLCLPIAMLDAIHNYFEHHGISKKRRSQWIEMTVEDLLRKPEYQDLVLEEFLEAGSNRIIPLSLRENLKAHIDSVVQQINQKSHHNVESSALLRTAISQYLIRHTCGKDNNGKDQGPQPA